MSDPALELGPALAAWLRADGDVIAAFAASSATLKVLDKIPLPNTPKPYIFIDGVDDGETPAECLDATEAFLNIGIWSLPTDGDKAEARRIGKAVRKALARMENDIGNSPEFTLAGFKVRGVYDVRTAYLTDPSDNKTIHGVLNATLSIDPV